MAKKSKGLGGFGLTLAFVACVLLALVAFAPIAYLEWSKAVLESLQVRFLLIMCVIVFFGVLGLVLHHHHQEVTIAQFIAQIARYFLLLGFGAIVTPGGLSYLAARVSSTSGEIEVNFGAATWVTVGGLVVIGLAMVIFMWILAWLQSQRMSEVLV
jgi:hypothetical protein